MHGAQVQHEHGELVLPGQELRWLRGPWLTGQGFDPTVAVLRRALPTCRQLTEANRAGNDVVVID